MQNNVYDWLVDSAEKYPNKKAIFDENGTYTFKELLEKSIAIGEEVSKKNNGKIKRPIAVFGGNSRYEVLAFLSVVYSGNFYVPIDREMPIARVKKIFRILRPVMCLCLEEDYSLLKKEFNGIEIIEYSKYLVNKEIIIKSIHDKLLAAPYKKIIREDLLYVIFTSGSTGDPKGVAIPHRGVLNYISWVTECFSISSDDVIGNQAPFYFDNSVLDIFSMLKMGCTLYIIPHLLFSQPVPLLKFLYNKKISLIFWVPSALVLVARARALKKVNLNETLKTILFAGEVMPAKQLNYWREYIPDAIYANLYGPTEITVDCTFYKVNRKFLDNEEVPIGKAISNVEVFVVDESDNIIEEKSVVGELCVRGEGLSVGYYNNPQKTREVFTQNPLNSVYYDTVYRTGDMVKYNEYGELVFVSRKDFQIKHMGHRIELGEIESIAASFGEISNSCCLYDKEKKKIVMFVDSSETEPETIIKELKNRLPKYMIPNEIRFIKDFPYTKNGKIDRKKLLETV